MGLRTTLKSLWQSTVELWHYLVSEFITNKDESKGILDYDKYQQYTKQLENPYLTQTESDSIQGKMISEGIIDPYRYSNYLSKTSSTEQSKEDIKSWVNAFRTWLSATLKDNYVAWDKYQREVLNKAINELTKQYQWTLENVETTYKEYGDDKLKQKRDELRPEYEQLIKDSAKKFATYINEWLDYNTAYSKLIDEWKDKANRIVQIQNELRRRQDWWAWVVGAFKQAGEAFTEWRIDKTIGKSVLWLFNVVNWALNLLWEWIEEWKQLAGWYDVLEELNSLNIYKDSKPILNQWRTLKSYWYEILDVLPQILPSIWVIIVGNKLSAFVKLDQIMTQLARGWKLADTLVDVSRTGKFLSESLQDFLIMDAAAQPIMGRPMTSEDFWTNRMYNLPVNAGIAMISRWLKLTDKVPKTLLTSMWTDADKLSKAYIDILKDWASTPEDAAIALMANNSLINKLWNNIEPDKQQLLNKIISYVDLPTELKDKHLKVMERLTDYNKNIDAWTSTYKDILLKKVIDSIVPKSIVEEADWANILKSVINRVKIIQDATLVNTDTLNKMVHGTVLNLYKQWQLTTDILTNTINWLPEWYGKDIIKAIWYWEKWAISRISRAIGTTSEDTAKTIKKEIDDTYKTFEHAIINNIYKNNPTGKRTVWQYKYDGNGNFINMISWQVKSYWEISSELLSIDKNRTEKSVLQASRIKNEIKRLVTNPGSQTRNAEWKIKLSDKIYQWATWQSRFIDIYKPDTMAKWALSEMDWILKPFWISYTKNADWTLSFWISSKWLIDFNNTLDEIESKWRDFLNLTDNHFKAYQVIFLKQHMAFWNNIKWIQKTLESKNIKLESALAKPTFFENLYSDDLAIDNKILNIQTWIEPEHAVNLNKALNDWDFDKIEEASATILIHDAMWQWDIMKALPLYKQIQPLKESILSIDEFSVMLPKWLNAKKEISTILGKIVADIQSTRYLVDSVPEDMQKKIYTITISKLITQDDKLLVKISDAQSAWTEIIQSNNKWLLRTIKNTDIKLWVELSLSDKIANVSNINKLIEAADISKQELPFKDWIIKFKQKLKDMSNKDILEVTDDIHWDTILKLFIAESLSNTKYYSNKMLNNIFDKFQWLIQFVKSLDWWYKVNIVKWETKITDWIINIWREDIMRLVRSDVSSNPTAIYNALFQAIKKQANIAELYKLQWWEIWKYIKWDIKPNLISDLIEEFGKTIWWPKKVKEELKQFIKIYDPSITNIFSKYPEILEKIDNMIDSWISVNQIRELAMDIYSKESINNISQFTEYLYKLNELTKSFWNIISPKESKKVLEKAQTIKDILDKLDTIWLWYKWLSQPQLEETLVWTLWTTNTASKIVSNFQWENLITSTTSMPWVLLDIDNSIKKNTSQYWENTLSSIITKYWEPKTIDAITAINSLNSKVSTIWEAIWWRLVNNVAKWQKLKPIDYLNSVIWEDTIRQYLKLGWDNFMPLDTYISNKITAEILHANGMYNLKNITDINNYIKDRTMDLTLTTLGKDYKLETRNMIAKYLMENSMISDITAKNIPESLPSQIAAYKLMDWWTDRSKEDAQDALAGIVVEIRQAFFDANKDMSKKEASAFADELSYTIEDIDESMVDRMVDDIWDKMYNKNLFVYNLDIIGQEHKPFEALQYNVELVLWQNWHARKWISITSKVRQLWINESIKKWIIDRATVSFGKIKRNLLTAKREDVFDDMLWKYSKDNKIQILYNTKAGQVWFETISYNWVRWTSLWKWFIDKLWLKELPDRRITRLEIFQAMRDNIYNSIWFKNIDASKPINSKLLNKKQVHILNNLNKSLDKIIKWSWDASWYNADALQKIFNTQIDLVDNTNFKDLPSDYQWFTIVGIVPRYNIISDLYQSGKDEIWESIWDNIARSVEDVFDMSPMSTNTIKEADKINVFYKTKSWRILTQAEVAKLEWDLGKVSELRKMLNTWELELDVSIQKWGETSLDSLGISTTPNRDSDRYIIEAVDNNTWKKYIWVIESVDWRNVFTPHNYIEESYKPLPHEYKWIISDIKFKENFEELWTYFKC